MQFIELLWVFRYGSRMPPPTHKYAHRKCPSGIGLTGKCTVHHRFMIIAHFLSMFLHRFNGMVSPILCDVPKPIIDCIKLFYFFCQILKMTTSPCPRWSCIRILSIVSNLTMAESVNVTAHLPASTYLTDIIYVVKGSISYFYATNANSACSVKQLFLVSKLRCYNKTRPDTKSNIITRHLSIMSGLNPMYALSTYDTYYLLVFFL